MSTQQEYFSIDCPLQQSDQPLATGWKKSSGQSSAAIITHLLAKIRNTLKQ